MKFRYKLQKDTNDSFLVTFPDIPKACTVIEKLEDLNNEATDALISAFDFYIESNMEIPCYKGKSSDVIFLSTNIALKVLLHNEFISSNIKKADIARRTNIATPNLERVFNFRYKSKIEAIESVLNCLGKKVDVFLT